MISNKHSLVQNFTNLSTVPTYSRNIQLEFREYLLNKWSHEQTAFKVIKETSVNRKFETIKILQKDDDNENDD